MFHKMSLVTTENSALDDHLVSPRISVTSSMLETRRNNSERFLLLQILTLKLALATWWILEILWNSCNLFKKKKKSLENTRFPSPWQKKRSLCGWLFSWRLPQPTGRPPTEIPCLEDHLKSKDPGKNPHPSLRWLSVTPTKRWLRSRWFKSWPFGPLIGGHQQPLKRSQPYQKGHVESPGFGFGRRLLGVCQKLWWYWLRAPPPKKNSAVHSMESFPGNRKRYLKSWDPSNASGVYIWAKTNWLIVIEHVDFKLLTKAFWKIVERK